MAIRLSLERAKGFLCANNKLPHFFLSFEKRRQRGVSASLEEMSNVTKEEGAGKGETG